MMANACNHVESKAMQVITSDAMKNDSTKANNHLAMHSLLSRTYSKLDDDIVRLQFQCCPSEPMMEGEAF
jgi:hypothetical protein